LVQLDSPTPRIEALLPSVGDIASAVVGTIVSTVISQPLLVVLIGIAAVAWAVRAVRTVAHAMHPVDPIRSFGRGDKAILLARAGHRCEHHHPLYGRCPETDRLQADHVHPHSLGGSTAVENGQALCPRHNRFKGARIPWNWELRRLERRRAGYFPPGMSGLVVRRRPR
jgi:hypothetical protein